MSWRGSRFTLRVGATAGDGVVVSAIVRRHLVWFCCCYLMIKVDGSCWFRRRRKGETMR